MEIMHTMASEAVAERPKRRFYSPELKTQVVAQCKADGASVAGIALAHGINANIVHRWLREHALRPCRRAGWHNKTMAILVGTASWTDKTLVESGLFYPPEAKSAEARLRFYASRFPMVEVDSSYYAIPQPATSQLWVERTPPGFVFNIKAFRLFTGHQTSPTVLHQDIFNNNYQDQGQRNAATLMRLLGDAPSVSPAVSTGDLFGD